MVDKSISLYSDSNKIDVSVNEKKARKGKSLSASTHYLFPSFNTIRNSTAALGEYQYYNGKIILRTDQ